MRFGCSRVLVLIAMAALLGSVQCYGNCLIAACGAAQTPSDSCHHHKPSHDNQAGCAHQYSEFTSPESGIAKAGVEKTAPLIPLLTSRAGALQLEPALLLQANTVSHSSHASPALSILRI
jgi:hypothetical protein